MHERTDWSNRFLALAAVCFLMIAAAPAALRAQTGPVLVVGEELAASEALRQRLGDRGLEIQAVDAADLSLNADDSRLLVVGSRTPVPPEMRGEISRFLEAGGHVIVVGPHNFDYAPQPVRPVALGRFGDDASYTIDKPDPDSRATIETVRIEHEQGPEGADALRLRTYLRGMGTVTVSFDAREARSAERSVLTFWGRGNAYVDLLSLQIQDTAGRTWRAFVPLKNQWERHAVSLADFIPEGWDNPREPYPLLDPATVETVSMGTDMKVLWREKAMDLALADVDLAEDEGGIYAPTSALLRLRLPFHEHEIAAPQWLFDPFFQHTSVTATQGLTRDEPSPLGSASIAGQVTGWVCPPPHLEHPGTPMGSDNRQSYNTKPDRRMRRMAVWRSADGQGAAADLIAELRIAAAGDAKGSSVALFGLSPEQVARNSQLADSLAQVADYILTRPKVVDAIINTTRLEDGGQVSPTLTVTVQNPTGAIARGRLSIDVAQGRVTGELPELAVPVRSTATRTIELTDIPEDFPFERFDWQITFETADASDTLHDTVDVERGMLHAFIHMLQTQSEFPDGRYSHHYFGDAYGVRAMFAYLDLLEREPQRLSRNQDLWKQISPEAIHESGRRWLDMMICRQFESGLILMGYAEYNYGSNVADGGQISLSIGQIAPLLNDPQLREQAWQFCRRFVDWAETFYIDEELSKQLTESHPEEAEKGQTKAGHYGLGVSGSGRRSYGPRWVLPDILGIQNLLTYVDASEEYRRIAERNTRYYINEGYDSVGYYHAEALVWSWLSIDDDALRQKIYENLRDTFLAGMLKGKAHDMYDFGARGTLRALPLLYYRQFMDDTPNVRAALLKYVWAFASEDASDAIRRISEAHPKPHHGESITAIKYATFSAVWAMELIEPTSTLLDVEGFPRVEPSKPRD